MTDVALLERIAAGFLLASAKGRDVFDTGAFRVFLSNSPEPYLSLALPQKSVLDWKPAIEEMNARFAQRALSPRLEVFSELFPTLGAALEEAGFVRTDEAPLMALTAADMPQPVSDAACIDLAAAPRLLEPFLYGQTRAYGGSDDGALSWLAHLQAGLAAGNILAAVLLQEDKVVAGASIQRGGEVGELAGVWTQAELRRQGLAERVCRVLASSFFATGGTLCWLSATPDATGLYRKLGFRDVGTQVNYAMGR